MAKPYTYSAEHKGYQVEGCPRVFKTKAQAGAVATQLRSKHHAKDHLLPWYVRGTFDVLGRGNWWRQAVPRPVVYQLSDNGRARLQRLRDKKG